VIVVFWMLAAVLMMLLATVWGAVRIQRADSSAFHSVLRYSALADEFRGDVARASAAPLEWGALRADEACLFLDFPDGTHAVYYVGEHSLERIDLDAAYEPSGAKTIYTLDTKQITFSRNETGQLLTLRLTNIEPRVEHKHSVDIMAALGGDLR
jgi:hypothetical protein